MHSYHQRTQDLDLISLVQIWLRGQLIEVFKYLNRFTTASARGLFDYDLNDRKGNNGAIKTYCKIFQYISCPTLLPIKITTTWNALPNEVVTSKTVYSFKISLDKHWAENPPNVRVYWSQSSTIQTNYSKTNGWLVPISYFLCKRIGHLIVKPSNFWSCS